MSQADALRGSVHEAIGIITTLEAGVRNQEAVRSQLARARELLCPIAAIFSDLPVESAADTEPPPPAEATEG